MSVDLPDLANVRSGATVVACSDEFFAPAIRMLDPQPPVSRKGEFDEHGQWMDGWETRRRRGARRHDGAFDWAVVRLGSPGVVETAVLDTANFSGNQMESAALDVAYLPGNPSPEEVLAAEWTEVLPTTPLGPDAAHVAAVPVRLCGTHVRLRAAPDGGLARLRLHGRALVDPRDHDGLTPDLAAEQTGGLVTACSDMHFGRRGNLIAPGDSRTMGEGWETRRRRGPGEDWAVVHLAAEADLVQVVVDTRHFKGNAPESCDLEGSTDGETWTPLVQGFRLQPDQRHAVRIPSSAACSWLRLTVHPDGGVARLQAFGTPTADGRSGWLLHWLAALPAAARHGVLRSLCGSTSWVQTVDAESPWASPEEFLQSCRRSWEALGPEDWLQALSAHPRIGDRPAAGSQERREQSAAEAAPEDVRAAIARGNADYDARFGFTYVVRAAGRSAQEMLALLEQRLRNDSKTELGVAAGQQWEITALRIQRLLHGEPR